jgi:predicted MPP superfamily phosphohydrolase
MTDMQALFVIIATYNALMLAVNGITLAGLVLVRWIFHRPAFWLVAWVVAAASVAGIGAVLAVLLAVYWNDHLGFVVMNLGTWLAFLHGPLFLMGSAATGWTASRLVARGLALMAIVLLLVAANAFLIEPFSLEVTTYTVSSPKVVQATRIVVIADLQTDAVGEYEREVLRTAMGQQPDLILLAGDYLQQNPLQRELVEDFRRLLRESGLSAPLGVYAVQGDVEHADWPVLFRDLPVTVMEGVQTRKVGWLRITSLGLWESRMVELEPETVPIPQSDDFHILLGHAPDFALGEVPADLLVAGHTHGGQVQLPLIGPLVTGSAVPRAWAAGDLVTLEGGRTLVVSRGVGMERGWAPRVRFLCRPQLVVIDLEPAS